MSQHTARPFPATPEPAAPWRSSYDPGVPHHLSYKDNTLYEALADTARRFGSAAAYAYMGTHCTYADLLEKVHRCAMAFGVLGVRPGDRVTLCLPNCPQNVIAFYALNLLGAVANMVHPLSAESEIAFYLKDSQSVAAVTLEQFYPKFARLRQTLDLPTLVVTSPADELSVPVRMGYGLLSRCRGETVSADSPVLHWQAFLRQGAGTALCVATSRTDDPAVILYSGGTTGANKGILLSNRNFNALAAQIVAANPMFRPGDKMLAVLPMFHGFGLGVSVHAMLWAGGQCILAPRFTPESYLTLLKKHRPQFIAGVPSLYEALLRAKPVKGLDLSALKGVFSGGDSLSSALKARFDAFLVSHGSPARVREGYGATECVTASCLMPVETMRTGSIGLPLPDMCYQIVRPGTEQVLDYGQEGEICLSGPTVMLGYVNAPEETAAVLRTHADGRIWVHTGDLGVMERDGFLYFRQRLKRMIVTNGYNVYPSQLEAVLERHGDVQISCVIGLPDALRGQRVKAFVVLRPGLMPSEDCRQTLLAHCRAHIARYAVPTELEFRTELPKTLVGKVAYRFLEEEETAKPQSRT